MCHILLTLNGNRSSGLWSYAIIIYIPNFNRNCIYIYIHVIRITLVHFHIVLMCSGWATCALHRACYTSFACTKPTSFSCVLLLKVYRCILGICIIFLRQVSDVPSYYRDVELREWVVSKSCCYSMTATSFIHESCSVLSCRSLILSIITPRVTPSPFDSFIIICNCIVLQFQA